MEIREYVRTKRRWLLPLVAVPILAGVLTGGVLANQAPESTVRVYVQVPPDQSNSDSQIGLYVARFREALNLAKVRKRIADEAGIDREQLRTLDAARRGQSDQFTVSLTTTAGGERTLTAAETAARMGSVSVAEQSTESTDELLAAAKVSFDEAQNALFAYQDEIGDLDPNATYAAVTRQLLSPGAPTEALQAQQAELVPQVRRFNELKTGVAASSGRLSAAQNASAKQRAEVAAAESGRQILESDRVRRSTLRPIIQSVALAAFVAFLAVLGLSLLPDLFRRQRTPGTGAGPTATAEAASARPQPIPAQQAPTEPAADRLPPATATSSGSDGQTTNGVPLHSSSNPASG